MCMCVEVTYSRIEIPNSVYTVYYYTIPFINTHIIYRNKMYVVVYIGQTSLVSITSTTDDFEMAEIFVFYSSEGFQFNLCAD